MSAEDDFEKTGDNVLEFKETWVRFYRSIPRSIAIPMPGSDFFTDIWNEHPKEKAIIYMSYGGVIKQVLTPRYQQSYGRDYYFTGANHVAKPIESFPHDFLNTLLSWSNHHMKQNKFYGSESNKDCNLNSLLVNWYDTDHYIGKHSDDESQLVSGMPIYSFSFGHSRDFDLTQKHVPTIIKTRVLLPHNSLIIMGGTCQKTHYHAVPKRAHSGKRINVTIRCFK